MKRRKFNSFGDFSEWCKDRWFMPGEFIPNIVERNFQNSFVIFSFIALYGLASLIFYVFRHSFELNTYYSINKMIYYGSMIVVSLFSWTLSLFLRNVESKHFHIKSIPVVLCSTILLVLTVMDFYVLNLPYSGTILFLCIGIVANTFFIFPPTIIYFVEIIICSIIGKSIYANWGLVGLADIVVISHLLLFLALFKWRITKRDLIRNEMLETHKEVLESEVERKSEEIQTQNYELQKQHEKLISIQNNTIISLSNLVENRDSDTGEHVRRTSAYVKLLACYAKASGVYTDILTDEYIELLTRAAPMHDIGKIVVPDSVLKKPGKLTQSEFEQIKMHTTEGGRIIREILGDNEDKKYISIAKDVALCHHERWDGKGYPYNLREEDIPLSARIMAIADVFDALVSPRCYKEPFPVDKAFSIIKEESGSHFDPKLTELFVNLQDDVVAVMDRYADKKTDF